MGAIKRSRLLLGRGVKHGDGERGYREFKETVS
jgi:hypothetical protein